MWVMSQDKGQAVNLATVQSIYASDKKGSPSAVAHNVNGTDNRLGVFASMDDARAEISAIMDAMADGAAAYDILSLTERRLASEGGQ